MKTLLMVQERTSRETTEVVTVTVRLLYGKLISGSVGTLRTEKLQQRLTDFSELLLQKSKITLASYELITVNHDQLGES